MKGKKLDLSAVLQKKSVLLLLLAGGLLLLLLPRSSVREAAGSGEDVCTEAEKRLCAVLSQMDRVGEAYVLLSEEPNHRGVFTGAVIVCSGAGAPGVQLRIVNAVSAFTGLGSNRIIVEELKS